MTQAYPLHWPEGWRRTASRDRKSSGTFKVSQRDAVAHVYEQIDMLSSEGGSAILSTNLQPRIDGMPLSRQTAITDPGAAIYFRRNGRDQVLACDTYDDVRGNIRALGLTLEALRGIERWGASDLLDRAFTGFVALAAPEQWWQVLGIAQSASHAEIDAAYRRLARTEHPDHGGTDAKMARLNAARDTAKGGGQ